LPLKPNCIGPYKIRKNAIKPVATIDDHIKVFARTPQLDQTSITLPITSNRKAPELLIMPTNTALEGYNPATKSL